MVIPATGHLVVGGALVGFSDIGDVLPGGQVQGRQAIGRVRRIIGGIGQQCAHGADALAVMHLLGGNAQILFHHRPGNGDLRGNPPAPALEQVHRRGFLLRVKIAGQQVMGDRRAFGPDPLAGDEGGPAGHVLAGGVPRAVIETGEDHIVRVILLYFIQLTHGGGGFRHLLDALEVSRQPQAEVPRLPRTRENEHRRPLHGLARDRGGHAAAFLDHPHAAVVAGQHGAFDRGHGDIEFALGVLAVDQQRAGQANGNLRHPEQVLDIAGHLGGLEGELFGVLQCRRRILFDKRLALPHNVHAVIVVVGTRDFFTHGGCLLIGEALKLRAYPAPVNP